MRMTSDSSPPNGAANGAPSLAGSSGHLDSLLAKPQVHKLWARYSYDIELTRHQLGSLSAFKRRTSSRLSTNSVPPLSARGAGAMADEEERSWRSDGSVGVGEGLRRIPSFEEFRQRRLRRRSNSLSSSCASTLLGSLEPDDEDFDLMEEEDNDSLSRSWCEGASAASLHRHTHRRTLAVAKTSERRKVIEEIIDSERRYGADLDLVLSEFHEPLETVLSSSENSALFANLPELCVVHRGLLTALENALGVSPTTEDPHLTRVDVGKVFLGCANSFLAFEPYCTNHRRALATLRDLERHSPLMRQFLGAARSENPQLRRQDLKSFLILPVQRLARYPLLLRRLEKARPSPSCEHRKTLRQAVSRINAILRLINGGGASVASLGTGDEMEDEEEPEESIADEMDYFRSALRILCVAPTRARLRHFGSLRARAAATSGRRVACHALLLTLFDEEVSPSDLSAQEAPLLKPQEAAKVDRLLFTKLAPNRQHLLVLFHASRSAAAPSLIREPIRLSECILSRVVHHRAAFQLHVMSTRDSIQLSGDRLVDLDRWYGQIKQLVLSSGAWRQRRNALPHVMLTTRRCSMSTAL